MRSSCKRFSFCWDVQIVLVNEFFLGYLEVNLRAGVEIMCEELTGFTFGV